MVRWAYCKRCQIRTNQDEVEGVWVCRECGRAVEKIFTLSRTRREPKYMKSDHESI